MQDALLCYHIVMNMLQAGYFADAVELLRQAWMQCRDHVAGMGWIKPPISSVAEAPAMFRELEEWAQRLTRMESYVTSMA